jgi:predicted Zn-dependent protease
MPGFGDVQHTVSTANDEAQKFFNQGLALCYGFNHNEGERAFRKAVELDPKMAMAWWGVAYAVGPNYNLPVDEQREKIAFAASQKAKALAADATQQERDYIDAVATRYNDVKNPDYQKLQQDYADAMKALSQKYPDDLDAATLYAESLMNLHPWKLWDKQGNPNEGTEEIVRTLKSVLQSDPNHIGANHFYIHAVEASNQPEKANDSAHRLAGLAPASGHLVHMPAHIFIRTGEHEASEKTNVAAAQADEDYLKATGAQGVYPMMYYTHNLHFIAVENAFLGRYVESIAAANKVQKHVAPMVKEMPIADGFYEMPLLIMVRFRRWKEILQATTPDPSLPYSNGMWHYARGMAFAGTGKLAEARKELATLAKMQAEIASAAARHNSPNSERVGKIMQHQLEAKIALGTKDRSTAITFLCEAVAVEDTLDYMEPPDWFAPARETLGGILLQTGKATEAEQVFREDLKRNPRNPRSIFGLAKALTAQGKKADAKAQEQAFESAWKNADVRMKAGEL